MWEDLFPWVRGRRQRAGGRIADRLEDAKTERLLLDINCGDARRHVTIRRDERREAVSTLS